MTRYKAIAIAVAAATLLAACATPPTPEPLPPAPSPPGSPEQPYFTQVGVASWYGSFHQGRKTANGERFDMNAMTAAHRSLPMDTVVRVTNLENDKTVKVRINDRGPYARNRIIDLSAEAARDLDMHDDGVARVRIEAFKSDQQPE